MGRSILQMMISVDGMISGPQGELDWIADDEPLNRVHLAVLEQADVIVFGAGSYAGTSSFWTAAEQDEKAEAVMRDLGRAMNKIPKIIYSHQDMPVSWRNTKVHVVKDDKALVEDVERLKRETEGTIIVYGGVRLARSFVQQDLLDEIHSIAMCQPRTITPRTAWPGRPGTIGFAQVLTTVFIWLVVFSVYILPVALIVWLVRRWRRAQAQQAAPAVATTTPPPQSLSYYMLY